MLHRKWEEILKGNASHQNLCIEWFPHAFQCIQVEVGELALYFGMNRMRSSHTCNQNLGKNDMVQLSHIPAVHL